MTSPTDPECSGQGPGSLVDDGYRGIWFTLGQIDGQYGDKYGGGLGTYTMKHVPTAVHAPDVNRTFFTYGAGKPDRRDLRIAVAYYDHDEHSVPRPRIVDPKAEADELNDRDTVVDPHDNASLALDAAGHVWVFVSGRGRLRPGRIYRSTDPYSISEFERVAEREMAYPQPWYVDGGFVHCFTKYTADGRRELYWETSPDGRDWSQTRELAGFGGHYQVSDVREDEVVTAFNWHPDGDVDRRTNLYVLRTRDADTWETLDGTTVATPLESPENAALVDDTADDGRLVYLNDLNFDADGNPVVLYLTSGGYDPGPDSDPRLWRVGRWDGSEWKTGTVTRSDHNYDSGSLYVRDGEWFVVGPTEPGPRPHHTGGRVAVWRSADRGREWERVRTFGARAGCNATYVRRPRGNAEPFDAFWADGDPSQFSQSRLYFASIESGECWQLPYEMDGDAAEPIPFEGSK
jgi:hypothetical protein